MLLNKQQQGENAHHKKIPFLGEHAKEGDFLFELAPYLFQEKLQLGIVRACA